MQTWQMTDEPSTGQLDEVAAVLRNGGVVLMPTDTIYGLHGIAIDDAAVGRLLGAKGREESKPFVVLGSSADQLESIGVTYPDDARASLEAIWPAPLTVILPLRAPIAASRGGLTLAVRVPRPEWLRRLISMTSPLASTSANRAGEAPLSDPSTLAADVQKWIDAALHGGIRKGEPSTIVDFTGGEPLLMRQGAFFFTQEMWKTLRKSL